MRLAMHSLALMCDFGMTGQTALSCARAATIAMLAASDKHSGAAAHRAHKRRSLCDGDDCEQK